MGDEWQSSCRPYGIIAWLGAAQFNWAAAELYFLAMHGNANAFRLNI